MFLRIAPILLLVACDSEAALTRQLTGDWTLTRIEHRTAQVGGGHGGETVETLPQTDASYTFEADGFGMRVLDGVEQTFTWDPAGDDQFSISIPDAFVYEIQYIDTLDKDQAVFWNEERYSFSGTEGVQSWVTFLER